MDQHSSPYRPSLVAQAAQIAAQNGLPLQHGSTSQKFSLSENRRYSVAALWSMAAENDIEVDDDLTKGILISHEVAMLFGDYTWRFIFKPSYY